MLSKRKRKFHLVCYHVKNTRPPQMVGKQATIKRCPGLNVLIVQVQDSWLFLSSFHLTLEAHHSYFNQTSQEILLASSSVHKLIGKNIGLQANGSTNSASKCNTLKIFSNTHWFASKQVGKLHVLGVKKKALAIARDIQCSNTHRKLQRELLQVSVKD